MRVIRRFWALIAVTAAPVSLLLPLLLPQAAGAQDPAAFYAGKSVDLDIGYSVGGGYDLYGRLLARHFGAHIPGNPTIVPKNMEGAGSLRLANYLFSGRPARRHSDRHHRPRHRLRSAPQRERRAI
ncbi:MAG: hypothetical protein WBD90_01990 [Xanthobacteraceae bacterium]